MSETFVDLLDDYLEKRDTYFNIKRVATDSRQYAGAYDEMIDARATLDNFFKDDLK